MCCGDFTVEILLWCLAVDMCCGVLLWCFAVEISLWIFFCCGIPSLTKIPPITTGSLLHLFHVEGNITIHNNKVSFMGVRGITGIERMQHTLSIEDPVAKVHMAVFCMKLGKRVQVRADGYAEQTLQRYCWF